MQVLSGVKGGFIGRDGRERREKRAKMGRQRRERSPCRGSFQTALRPLLVVRQGCRKLSRVPRASYFRIRHRFNPPSSPRYPTSSSLSCHSLSQIPPESGSLPSCRRPSASPSSSSSFSRCRNESFGSDRRNLAGIDNHGDGAVFPSDFHLLSSPPLVCTQTPPTYRPLLPFSLVPSPPSPDLQSAVYGSGSTRDHLRRNNDGRFYLHEDQLRENLRVNIADFVFDLSRSNMAFFIKSMLLTIKYERSVFCLSRKIGYLANYIYFFFM